MHSQKVQIEFDIKTFIVASRLSVSLSHSHTLFSYHSAASQLTVYSSLGASLSFHGDSSINFKYIKTEIENFLIEQIEL